MTKDKNLLAIGEAAKLLQISIGTLRNWDASGKLRALRTEGGHRYYLREELERFSHDLFALALVWAESATAPDISSQLYCETQDIFRARHERMAMALSENAATAEIAGLVAAVAAEIGNNSFDHNLGNWPDVPGVFFGYDQNKRLIALADRGVGVKTTLLRVRPNIKDDLTALKIAFTERISGRAPERRGNGLKFVYDVALKTSIGVSLQSGTAVASIAKSERGFEVKLAERYLRGTLTRIVY